MLLKLENQGLRHFLLENTLRRVLVVKGRLSAQPETDAGNFLRKMGTGNEVRKEGWDFGC